MARKRTNLNELAANWALSGAYTAATLWQRMSLMGAVAMMSEADRQKEAARMVAEKLAAGFEGSLNVGVQTMHMMADMARGRTKPSDLLSMPTTIANAGLQPAFRRVKANSRRLGRRSKGKR